VAESVFIGGLFTLAAQELAALAEKIGRAEEAAQYRQAGQRMAQVVLEHGWDGQWFRRAYDAFGEPIGTAQNEEGQIFIEPQGICVMAGIGLEDGRALQALEAVHQRLATPHGIVLLQPAYTHYDLRLGEITSYPPGYKENAGIFSHTNPWIMIAEARLGRGEQAHDYYSRINPSARQELAELHRCEPYVYAQMIAGKDSPAHGEAKNSWLTGSAAWNYVAITQWILGLRPTYDGLQVSPVIPPGWEGFRARRLFRGVEYEINVRRAGPGNRVSLRVDGQPVSDQVIPIPPEGTRNIDISVEIS